MTPPSTTVEPEAHLAAATYLLRHSHHSALVVTSGDTHQPVALITEAMIAEAVARGRDPESTRVREVITPAPLTVAPEIAAAEAARLMLSTGTHHLPVVDGTRLVGTEELVDLSRVGPGPGPRSAAPGQP